MSTITKGLKLFQGNNGKVIISGDDDVGCDPVTPIQNSGWWWTRGIFFLSRQKKGNLSNSGHSQQPVPQQHDVDVKAPQLVKESNTDIDRRSVKGMGIGSICAPELNSSPVSYVTEKSSTVYAAEDKKTEPSPRHRKGRKLKPLQDKIVVLNDVHTVSKRYSTPEMTSGYETFSSSSSCNGESSATNEMSGTLSQFDARKNGLDSSTENANHGISTVSGVRDEVQNGRKTSFDAGSFFSYDVNTLLNGSDNDCDIAENIEQGTLKNRETRNEESGGDGAYTSVVICNLTTDGYESFSSYSCDAEPEQQPRLNTCDKLEDHYDIVVGNREEETLISDSNEDESECMHDTDVYNWITTDKESSRCNDSWYKGMEESPKLEKNSFLTFMSPPLQQRTRPEGSKLGFVSSSSSAPVSRSHCRPGLSPLRFPTTTDSRNTSPSLSPQSVIPCVKETCNVSRKMASLPQQEQLSHPQPVGGDWLTNRYVVNNYILLNKLGQGSYGEVRLAKEKATNTLFAVKIINKDSLRRRKMGKDSTSMDHVKREIAIMKNVSHPNVLRLYEIMDSPKLNKVYLVLEYMKKGDLMKILNGDARRVECDPMSIIDVWHVFRQVVQGLSYLHLQNIIHGDIKPQNLLVDESNTVKIADFGISKIMQGSCQSLDVVVGTPAFMGPESLTSNAFNGRLADVWALGATIYMLLCGHPPFVASQLMELYDKIQKDPLLFPTGITISPGLRSLLVGMLVKDPSSRLTLDQVMQDTWLQQGDPPRGSLTSSGGLMSHPPPPPYFHHPKDFKRITISKEDIVQVFNEGNASEGSANGTYSPLSLPLSERCNQSQSPTGFSLTTTSPPPPAAVSPSIVADITSPVETHPQLTDKELHERKKKFSKLAAVTARQKGLALMYIANPKDGGDNSTECSEGAESDGAIDSNLSSSQHSSNHTSSEFGMGRVDSLEFSAIIDTLSAQPLRRPSSTNYSDDPNAVAPLISDVNLMDINVHAGLGLHSPQLGLSVASHSVKGLRPAQEDRVLVTMGSHSLPGFQQPDLLEQYALFSVLDGHNGAACATMLQSSLHKSIFLQPSFRRSIPDSIVAACMSLDSEICRWCRETGDESGSTALITCYDSDESILHIGSVGDSRCVLSIEGRAKVISMEQHRLACEKEHQRVEAAGGIIRNGRLNGILSVTRSFGDVMHKEIPATALIATPEVTTCPITNATEFFILGTDGLWDVMSAQHAVNSVRNNLFKFNGDMQKSAEALANEALHHGSIDNVSIIVLFWHK